eukprot:2466287-Pleurochrysis_carterae.AAC.1
MSITIGHSRPCAHGANAATERSLSGRFATEARSGRRLARPGRKESRSEAEQKTHVGGQQIARSQRSSAFTSPRRSK